MITIYIDDKPHQVKDGQNLLQACLSLGFDLPYFCWHPAMHSVGACRQCAIKLFKDEKDTRGRIVMSCMTPATDGMRLSVNDPDAKAFRSSVIEWLMLNHPHDCPVCDEGGECHLQDMTVMTGHNYRRTRFRKRTHRNQDLGPFINHEMNRCIQCYRCVRFYRDYAGGRDFQVFASHDNVYFGRHEDGALESEFSGNLVEVCPTGVFTDKTLKSHYTRKWDLQTAPSVCVHCGIGCNTIPCERYGTLRRILNRYNREVNGYFLCDRGRFGYEFVNSGRRIRKALLNAPLRNEQVPIAKTDALNRVREMLSKSKGVIGIGSPRASLESNFALRAFVGPDHFYAGVSAREHRMVSTIREVLATGPARTPSLHDVEAADAVFILGEDVSNTAPLLALAVRQAIRNKQRENAGKIRVPEWDDSAVRNAGQEAKGPFYSASPYRTRLDDDATKTFIGAPDAIAKLGFAVAHELDPQAPAVSDLTSDARSLAKEIAEELKSAKHPLIVSGTGCLSESVVQAAANVAWACCGIGKAAAICYAVPECNSMGLGLMGGGSLEEAMQAVQNGTADTVVILENDLFRRADEKIVHDFLGKTKNVIVVDQLINATSSQADITFPAATFAESDGTFVNNEGRAQRFYQVFKPNHDIQESWRWIHDIMDVMDASAAKSRQSLDELITDIASSLSVFAPVRDLAPPASFRVKGLKIPRQPHRYSGRTSMLAHISLHEPKPPEDPDTPLSFSMEGYEGEPPAPLIARYWTPGWNSVQSLNKFQQEVGGHLRGGDPGKRLLEPDQNAKPEYFSDSMSGLSSGKNSAAPPEYHIFGSEELSAQSAPIAERMKDKKPS